MVEGAALGQRMLPVANTLVCWLRASERNYMLKVKVKWFHLPRINE
jgi:hypothetical protein